MEHALRPLASPPADGPQTEAGRHVDLSVVIPVYNEAPALAELCRRTRDVLDRGRWSWEVVFVDDGSTDSSYAVLAGLHEEDARVRVVQLRANYGKGAALSAGFGECRGEVIVTMDGDLQDDPCEIPRLLGKLEEGFDLVSGWKRRRRDPLARVLASRLFNAAARLLSNLRVHDLNSGFKIMRREVAAELPLYGELYRFMPLLAHWRGFRVGEVAVDHHERRYGRSKYGWGRAFRAAMDLVTVTFLSRFRRRPAHFFGLLGSAVASAGALIVLYVLWLRLVHGNIQNRHPLLIGGVVLIVVGVQVFTTGLLGELLADAQGSRREQHYAIRKRLG
jgi:glycosyltransferase involved in cell wall biosynthesis